MAGRRDGRTFIVVHDGIADHPKIEPLSDKAFRLLIETWAWCSRQRTDGKVPLATWKRRSTGKARGELIANGLATVVGTDVEMHDYLAWQRSAGEIAEKVSAKQNAGLIGNHRRWHTDRGVSDSDCRFCIAEASQVRSQGDSQRDRETSPETEAETDKGKKTSSSSGRKRPATKLPDDWAPSDAHREYASEHGINLDREVFKFRYHAEANDRRQVSWNGTFSTWLANAVDWGSSGRSPRPTLRDPRSGIIVER